MSADPIPLTVAGKTEVIAYACGKCHCVAGSVKAHGPEAERLARIHCGPFVCFKCGVNESSASYNTCEACFRAHRIEVEQEQIRKAKKVLAYAWDGPVHTDDCDEDHGWYGNVDALIGDYESPYDEEEEEDHDHKDGLPRWVWGASLVKPALDADRILEDAFSDLHEIARENFTGDSAELQKMMDEWMAKHDAHCVSYESTNIIVVIDESWLEEQEDGDHP